jgi:hypothetical protein
MPEARSESNKKNLAVLSSTFEGEQTSDIQKVN